MKNKLIIFFSLIIFSCSIALSVTFCSGFKLEISIGNNISSESSVECETYCNEISECIEDSTATIRNVYTSDVELTTESVGLPSEYCMRDDYIIYTQNQDVHGFCWNFASSMALTTTIMKATNEYYDFSEAYIGVMADDEGGSYFGHGGVFLENYPRPPNSNLTVAIGGSS